MDEAFMVGSRVYGSPREDSDLDLVVPMAPDVAAKLYELAGLPLTGPLYFGKLNIIPATSDAQYEAWTDGLAVVLAEQEVKKQPVSMARARDIFRAFDAIHDNPSADSPAAEGGEF